MRRLLFFLLLSMGQITFGQNQDTAFGKPIFWYHVSDPWAMFMGAEGPVFILYESGKILFWKNGAYRLTQVDEQQKKDLIDELNLNDTLFSKSRHFDATNPDPNSDIMGAFDNPSYTISVKRDTLIRVSVYGYINSKVYRKRYPEKFLLVHNFIVNFNDDEAIEWIPEKIEIMLSDFSNSKDVSLKWSDYFPHLANPETIVRPNGMTSFYLDKKYFSELAKLLKKRMEKQAIEINGKKYYAEYRFPLPNLY